MSKFGGKKEKKIQYFFWFLNPQMKFAFSLNKSSRFLKIAKSMSNCRQPSEVVSCSLSWSVLLYASSLVYCSLFDFPTRLHQCVHIFFWAKPSIIKKLEGKMKKFRKKVFQRIQSNWPKKRKNWELIFGRLPKEFFYFTFKLRQLLYHSKRISPNCSPVE